METRLCKGLQIKSLRHLWHAFFLRHVIDVSVVEANLRANFSMQLPAFLIAMLCLLLEFGLRRYGSTDEDCLGIVLVLRRDVCDLIAIENNCTQVGLSRTTFRR
jgi:hypothetical protein